MAGFLLLSILTLAGSGQATPRCDLLEINHYHTNCNEQFTQLIAWDWSPQYKRWHAQQWVIVREWSVADGVVSCVEDGKRLRVAGRLFRETWTIRDPERQNQLLFPDNERRRVW